MTIQEAYKKMDLAIGIGRDRVDAKFNQLSQELNDKIRTSSNEKLKGIFVSRLNEVESAYAILLEHFDPSTQISKPIETVSEEVKPEPRNYFFYNGTDREGPVSLEELKNKEIKLDTLIWYEGLSDWKSASEIDELAGIFVAIPPPINKQPNRSYVSDTNDVNKATSVQINEPQNINITDTTSSMTNESSQQAMFSNIFSFEGRIRRSEYGFTLIIYVIIWLVIGSIARRSGDVEFIALAYIPMVWMLWAQGAKRCHDLGNSGWWQLIPFYVFWMIFEDGEAGINQYGSNPKQ
jgi:uncharacterized membrane protein YhaH (DUF805 family)